MSLKLVDLLGIESSNYKEYKVHFATSETRKEEPKECFINGTFDEWQCVQTKKNFNRKYVISLIWLSEDKWLFGGVYEVDGEPVKENKNGRTTYKYPMHMTNNQGDLVGRIIVNHKKEYRASYSLLETVLDSKNNSSSKLQISSILEKRLSIYDFPGFNKIDIDWHTLNTIIKDNVSSWHDALSNVKGIYLIRDITCGKMYVGKASGEDCLWSRWSDYGKNGHGNNVELKELLNKKGEDYKKNFRYSVLEICNMNLGEDYILGRESYWKDILMTRSFGYNDN